MFIFLVFPIKPYEPLHEISKNVAYAQSDQSLCVSLEYSMSVKLLTENILEFLSLKGDGKGSSESTLVKMPHCWKSHVTAHMYVLGGYKKHLTGISLKAPKTYCLKSSPIL